MAPLLSLRIGSGERARKRLVRGAESVLHLLYRLRELLRIADGIQDRNVDRTALR